MDRCGVPLAQVSHLLGIPTAELLLPAHENARSGAQHDRKLPTAVGDGGARPQPASEAQAAAPAGPSGGGAATAVPAQPRQPSDLILRLAAGAKAAQQQEAGAVCATPEGSSLKQPLQAGAAGVRGRSPPLPLGSPSFWQPFATARGSAAAAATDPGDAATHPRPASAPSPTAARAAAAAAVGGAFGRPPAQQRVNGGPAFPGEEWRAFDGVPPAKGPCAGAAGDEEWRPFQSTPAQEALPAAAAAPSRRPLDAWAQDQRPVFHAQSVPAGWIASARQPPRRTVTEVLLPCLCDAGLPAPGTSRMRCTFRAQPHRVERGAGACCRRLREGCWHDRSCRTRSVGTTAGRAEREGTPRGGRRHQARRAAAARQPTSCPPGRSARGPEKVRPQTPSAAALSEYIAHFAPLLLPSDSPRQSDHSV